MKISPKLTSIREGVATEVLAKAEAERAKKREREEREDELVESLSKRRRSVSSHSVSTISTGASKSRSPSRGRTRSPSPPRRRQSAGSERDSYQRGGRESRSRSPHPLPQRRGSISRSGRDPERRVSDRRYRDPEPAPQRYPEDDGTPPRRTNRYSSGSRGSVDSPPRRAYESRSPEPNVERGGAPDQRNFRRGRDGDPRETHPENRPGRPPPEAQPRERSLSPFSRRLALTQNLNIGRR